MLGIYPLKPVVCDEPRWKAIYDRHPESVQMASACVSADEVRSLLAQGARFEAIVLLNGAGEGLPVSSDMPVERLRIDAGRPGAVGEVHDALTDRVLKHFVHHGG
jgi:hypothetical protein